MIKQTTINKKEFILMASFDDKKINPLIIKEKNIFTEVPSKKIGYIYLGKKEEFKAKDIDKTINILVNLKRNYQVDIKSFITKEISEAELVSKLTEKFIMTHGEIFTLKTKKKDKVKELNLVNLSSEGENIFKIAQIEAETRNWARSFQTMPPNILNSENYAKKLESEFLKLNNVTVKVLNKKEIIKLKMGLLLGVNRGSEYEPRVVIVEYKGDPSSKDKTVYVGKGIMFDSGGYSLKTGKHIIGMKYDMSGTAIVAGAMKLIAHNRPKANVSIVMPLTDNMIGTKAQTVDAVQTSMSGKTVEINNTDAEGRLILADALTYSINKLNATRVADVATLTGAVLVALGSTYTGVWTTEESDWIKVSKAAKTKNELVWRLPLHDDFVAPMKKCKIADIQNTNYTGKGGSSSAAGFLKEFTGKTPFIHFDVAGTADVDGNPTGVMIKTLAKLAEIK